MKTLVLCMLLSTLLPLYATEKTAKMLIYEYEEATRAKNLTKQFQALRNIFLIPPSKFSTYEFNAIVEFAQSLHTQKSTVLREVPESWQIAMVKKEPKLHAAFPSLKIDPAPHEHHAYASSSAAVDEKRHAAGAASSSAAAAHPTPTVSLPKRKAAPPRIVRKTPQAPQGPIPNISNDLQRLIDSPRLSSNGKLRTIEYLEAHPEYINAVTPEDTSLLSVAIHASQNPGFLEELLDTVIITKSSGTYPNINLIRYIISQNPRLPSRGIDELKLMLRKDLRGYFLAPENADIIPALVDLMIGHGGVRKEEVEKIFEETLDDLDGKIMLQEEHIKELSSALFNNSTDSDEAEQAAQIIQMGANGITTLEMKRDILLKALHSFDKHEFDEAQETLDQAGLPPELLNIVHEYSVGGQTGTGK
jgi:hypothetical protein